MIRRPPRSTLDRSSAASDVYKRQVPVGLTEDENVEIRRVGEPTTLSLIHISEPTRLLSISYAVFCLKKKKEPPHSHQRLSSQPHLRAGEHRGQRPRRHR